jgi:hypothetical protein
LGQALFTIVSAGAQLERDLIRERLAQRSNQGEEVREAARSS